MAVMSDQDFFTNAILSAVKERVSQIAAEEIEAAQERVRLRVMKEVDRIALSIMSEYHIERRGSVVSISVQKMMP